MNNDDLPSFEDEEECDCLHLLPSGPTPRGEGAGVHEQHIPMTKGHGNVGVTEDDDGGTGTVTQGGTPVELGKPRVVATCRCLLQRVLMVAVIEKQAPTGDRDDLLVGKFPMRLLSVVVAVDGDDGRDEAQPIKDPQRANIARM